VNDLALFLCGLASIGLLAVGALALLSPSRLSRSYGVPVADRASLSYVRATGARDAIVGIIFAASVYLHDALLLLILAIAGFALSLGDFVIAYSFARGFHSEQIAHIVGAIGFIAIAALLAPSIHV
jgi:hypothetical protein